MTWLVELPAAVTGARSSLGDLGVPEEVLAEFVLGDLYNTVSYLVDGEEAFGCLGFLVITRS